MPIEIRHDDPNIVNALAFLTGQGQGAIAARDRDTDLYFRQQQLAAAKQQQAFAQRQAEEDQARQRDAAARAAAQQQAEQLARMAQGAQAPPVEFGQPSAGGGGIYDIDAMNAAMQGFQQQAAAEAQARAAAQQPRGGGGLRPIPGALRFLENQSREAMALANQQNQFNQQEAIAARQAANNAAQLQRQQIGDAADAQRQQQQAELQANLAQRNKLMQTAPGIIDPDTLANAQAAIQQNQDVLTGPAREARQKLLEGIAQGDPEAIQAGLQQGVLAFSPEQKTRIRQIREAMSQVDMDQSLSPYQRSIASKQLAEKLNAIRPMEVPHDQQPVDPVEQYHKDTLTMPDPATGIPVTRKKTFRNGEQGWELDEASKIQLEAHYKQKAEEAAHDPAIKAAELQQKQQELQMKQKQAEFDLYNKVTTAKLTLQQKISDAQVSMATARANLAAAAATPDGADDADAQEEITRIQQELDQYKSQISEFDRYMPAMPTAPQPMGMGESTAWRSDVGAPPLPPPTAPPAQSPYTLSPEPQAGTQQWSLVPIGSETTLPNGMQVRKTGPTTFERIR